MKKKIHTIGVITFFIDVLIKQAIINYIAFGKSVTVIPNFFYLTYVRNDGAAFSLFSGNVWFLIIINILVLLAINFLFIKDNRVTKIDMVSYGLLIGGILGNLFDRIMYGYVIDYLDFNIFGYNFAIFNLADTAVCVGVFLMIINMIKEYKNENNNCR